MSERKLSRRGMFRALLGRRAEVPASESLVKSEPPVTAPAASPIKPPADELALILGHFCLAYQGSFCSVCVERCPEPGAMEMNAGKPVVISEACTGCKVCQDVCPAPKNAIFMVARKPRAGMIGKTVTETTPDEVRHDPPQEGPGSDGSDQTH